MATPELNASKSFPEDARRVSKYPAGDWSPLPVSGYKEAMEYLMTDVGMVYVRPIGDNADTQTGFKKDL